MKDEVESNLTKLLSTAELTEFEEWWNTTEVSWKTSPHAVPKIIAWEAWKARGSKMSKCRGVTHHGCDYLAVCGHTCNKCGQIA